MKEEEREAAGTKDQQLGFFIYICIYIFCISTFSYEVVWFFYSQHFFSSLSLTCSMFFSFVQLNIRHAELITE